MMDLAHQFDTIIKKKIQNLATEKMEAKVLRAAKEVVAHEEKKLPFDNVTGNLRKSIAAGAYSHGNFIGMASMGGDNPTRPTLRAGEKYDLDTYYDGTMVWQHKRPYRAPKNSPSRGGQYGQLEAQNALVYGYPVDAAYGIRVIAAVDYAEYVTVKKGVDFIADMRDYLKRYFYKI